VLVTSRKICWPDPDATCLTGACPRCREGEWKRLGVIRRYAKRHKVLPVRYDPSSTNGGKTDALVMFEYGLRHNFFHTPVRGRLAKADNH
jgi:hypothetical protein